MRISSIKCIYAITVILILSQTLAAADITQNQTAGKSIAIVVDTSGSMRHLGGSVKSALTGFIEDLGAGWKVTFVTFDVFSDVKGTVIIESQAERNLLKSWVNSLSFNGKDTNFDEALKGAQAGLFQAGVRSNATISIFSDGISDPSDRKKVVDLQAMAKRVFPQEEGYSVYLVGVGEDAAATEDYSEEDNVVTLRISEEDMRKVLGGIQKNQNLLELLVADQKEAAQPSEEIQEAAAEHRGPTPSPSFLKENWKLMALALGIIAFCLIAYGVYWAFIAEDPEVKKKAESQVTEVKRAQFTVLDSDRRPYIARAMDGNRVNMGSGPECQVRIDTPDSVAASVVFSHDRAYITRRGRFPVCLNDEEINGRMELNSGDTVKIGDESVRFEVISTGRTKDGIDELLRSYRR